MSINADALRLPAGFHPLSRVRELFQPALPVGVPAEEPDLPQSPRNRHEALIQAARAALGGTVEW